MGAGGSSPSPPSPRVPGRPAHSAGRRAAPRPACRPRPALPPSALLPPRRAPYLAIAAALRAHWPRAGRVGAGPGPAGAGKEGGGGPARGEGGADPDVHSWAPGEVEAPGPAAGGRATDAGTGTAAAAATMVKARRHSLLAPRAPREPGSPLPPPPPHSPGPSRVGPPGGGGAGSRTQVDTIAAQEGAAGTGSWAGQRPCVPLPAPALGSSWSPTLRFSVRRVSPIAQARLSWTGGPGQAPPPVTQGWSSFLLPTTRARFLFPIPTAGVGHRSSL